MPVFKNDTTEGISITAKKLPKSQREPNPLTDPAPIGAQRKPNPLTDPAPKKRKPNPLTDSKETAMDKYYKPYKG